MASELGVQTIQHTNGTDALTIDSSGNITTQQIVYPKGLTYWPAACVHLTTSNTVDSNGDYNTTGAVKWDEILLNSGSVYSASTGIFTAPVAGIYEINTHILKDNTSTDCAWTYYKNGTNLRYGGYSATDVYATVSASLVLELDADDELYVNLQSGGFNINPNSSDQWNSCTFKYIGG